MAAHVRALFHGAVPLEEAETQTNNITTTSANTQTTPAPTTVDVSTQATSTMDKMISQTNDTPEHQCAALQTEPPDNKHPSSLKNTKMTLYANSGTQMAHNTNQTTTQTKDTYQSVPLNPVMHHDPPPNITMSRPCTTLKILNGPLEQRLALSRRWHTLPG